MYIVDTWKVKSDYTRVTSLSIMTKVEEMKGYIANIPIKNKMDHVSEIN